MASQSPWPGCPMVASDQMTSQAVVGSSPPPILMRPATSEAESPSPHSKPAERAPTNPVSSCPGESALPTSVANDHKT